MINKIDEVSMRGEMQYTSGLRRILQLKANPIITDLKNYKYQNRGYSFHDIMPYFEIEIKTINGVKAYYFKSRKGSRKNVVYVIHGGGYVLPISQNNIFGSSLYSQYTDNSDILLIDYTVKSQGSYEKTLEDAFKGYETLIDKYEHIVIAGQSAGAGLAVSLTHYLKDNGIRLPECLVLASPWLDVKCDGESYETKRKEDIIFGSLKDEVLPNPYPDCQSPYLYPLLKDFRGFPPVMVNTSQNEMVLSDTLKLEDILERSDVVNEVHLYRHMWHDFYTHDDSLPECHNVWLSIKKFTEKYIK